MRWYLSTNGQISGPFDAAVIAAWRDAGQIVQGTTACVEGDTRWLPFEQTPLAVAGTPVKTPWLRSVEPWALVVAVAAIAWWLLRVLG